MWASHFAKTLGLALGLALLAAVGGCTAFTFGAPLSGRPVDRSGRPVFLSTGGSPRPYQTIGFVQATGFGNQIAGVIDVGDAGLDATIGGLVDAAVRMGGQGVINIDFLDENPQTPAERGADLAKSMQSASSGKGEVKTRWRSVHATGEVIQFLP